MSINIHIKSPTQVRVRLTPETPTAPHADVTVPDPPDSSASIDPAPSASISWDSRNYESLANKPRIEGIVLIGDKTLEELGLDRITEAEIDTLFAP